MPFAQRSAISAPPAPDAFRPWAGRPGVTAPRADLAPLTRAERYTRWAVAGVVVLAVLSALAMLWWPLGYDQSIFAQNGAVLLDGGAPYRDAFETRGPVAFYLFAAIEAVFGRSPFAIRFFDLLVLGAANVLMWRVLRPFVSRRHATVALALWTIYTASWTYNDTAQPDMWSGYAMLLAAVLAIRDEDTRTRDLLIAGVLVGLCALMKPFYVAFLLVPALAVAVRTRWAPRPVVRACAALGAGCAIPVAIVLAALWAKGAIPAMIDVHVLFNTRVYATAPVSALAKPITLAGRIRQVIEFPRSYPQVALAVPPAVVGLAVLWRQARPLAAALAAATAIGAACVAIQGKFFFYHWEIALVPVFVCATVGLSRLVGDRGLTAEVVAAGSARAPQPVRMMVLATAAMMFLAVAVDPALEVKRWLAFMSGRASSDMYYGNFEASRDINPADQMRAAAYLRAHTTPGTPVAIWGVDAAIPFLAGRPGASRFPMTRYFEFNPDAPQTRAYRREYADVMRAKRPPYLVNGLYSDRFSKRVPKPIVEQWPEIGSFIDDEYVLAAHIGDLDVYRRRDYQPPVQRSGRL